MATTQAQELNALIGDTHQNKEDINTNNETLSLINSVIQVLQDQCSYLKELKYLKATFEQFMGYSQNPSSYEQPSYQDDHEFSHCQGPHTTQFSRDLHPPRIEVNKFDEMDPT
jgi:hypothetical protein